MIATKTKTPPDVPDGWQASYLGFLPGMLWGGRHYWSVVPLPPEPSDTSEFAARANVFIDALQDMTP